MEKEYLTIKEALAYTGASDSSVRRWVRSVRNQYQIELDYTNEQLEQATPILRKENNVEADGTPRRDRHGLPVFDWLLHKPKLTEVFGTKDSQTLGDHPADLLPQDGDNSRDGSPDTGQSDHEEVHKIESQEVHDDSQQNNDKGQEDYLWMNRQVFENLIAQLDTKDKQIDRKDDQLEQIMERQRETNVLLQSYQKSFGLLPEPKEKEEDQPTE